LRFLGVFLFLGSSSGSAYYNSENYPPNVPTALPHPSP
jgi:hypothetical protein